MKVRLTVWCYGMYFDIGMGAWYGSLVNYLRNYIINWIIFLLLGICFLFACMPISVKMICGLILGNTFVKMYGWKIKSIETCGLGKFLFGLSIRRRIFWPLIFYIPTYILGLTKIGGERKKKLASCTGLPFFLISKYV